MTWQIYILRCSNGSYYVGHTNNLEQRLLTHQQGKGSSHTAKYRPVELVYSEELEDKAACAQRERQLKNWSRAKKEALMRQDRQELKHLSRCRSQHPS